MIAKLKTRWADYKERRFLKRHGCETREQYNRRYDPDFCYRTSEVKRKYHGYHFVYCIDTHNHYAYKCIYDYGPGGLRFGYDEMNSWCKNHCEGKFRLDALRVMWNQWANDWEENGIGGGDYVFFAFQDEIDYMNFLLRWSGVNR